MKTHHIALALALVTTAAPVAAQQLTLLGQSSQQTAITRPPPVYTADGTSGRTGVILAISVAAIPADPALRTLSGDDLIHLEPLPEMLVTLQVRLPGPVSLAFKNQPIRVTNDTDGTSLTMWSDSPIELRTRAGARIHAHMPPIGSVGELRASVTVPPARPRPIYDGVYERFYDYATTVHESQGWIPFIKNDKKSERREVRFHVDEKGRLERRTIITTIYGW